MIVGAYKRRPNESVKIERIGDCFIATLFNGLNHRTWTSARVQDGILAEIVLVEMHMSILRYGFRPVDHSE